MSSWSILKSEIRTERTTILINGQLDERKCFTLENQRYLTLPQPTTEEIIQILQLPQLQYSDPSKKILWVDLRLEPHLFMSGIPYALRDIDTPLEQLNDYTGIELHRLEELEKRLKEDVIEECIFYNGRIVIHCENGKEIVPQYLDVDHRTVKTMIEVFKSLPESIGSKVSFYRVPFSLFALHYSVFDYLKSIFDKNQEEHIIFNSCTGSIRTIVATIIAILIRTAQKRKLLIKDKSPRMTNRGFFTPVKRLVQVLPDALDRKNELDRIINHYEENRVNIRELIYSTYERYLQESDPSKKVVLLDAAKSYLETYCKLILFSSYLWQDSVGNETFEVWVKRRAELKWILSELKENPVQALQSSATIPTVLHDEEPGTVVKMRDGPVLQSSHILKSDHFPGCHKDWLPYFSGAPNFRQVSGFPIFGVGIPTRTGLENVFSLIPQKRVFWIFLREEPVIYVNGLPFVLRDNAHPFRNLEYTGISGENVEDMEQRLVLDALNESKKYNGRLLLHNEQIVDGQFKVTTQWVDVTEETIQTPRQIYLSEAQKSGVTLHFFRVPVTDERVMQNNNFDEVTSIISNALKEYNLEDIAFTFNCQMGQGRTTTGVTVATLLVGQAVPNKILTRSYSKKPLRMSAITHLIETGDAESVDTKAKSLLSGDYSVVLSLKRLLGPSAKGYLDEIIDRCSTVTNLREIVYQTHVRSETAPHLFPVAVNFLERYCYLLLFSQYVMDQYKVEEQQRFCITFDEWFKSRPELRTILSSLAETNKTNFK
uniref:Tyrosine specific protein phosphatases domain-containing protein n=1 Tax=Arcella intermedia TaxID=1963864 RepID=A0A6B2KYI3_9EUKA